MSGISWSGGTPAAILLGAQTSAFTVTSAGSFIIPVDSSGGAFAITMHGSPNDGDSIRVIDVSGSCATNGVDVAGITEINSSLGSREVTYIGGSWVITDGFKEYFLRDEVTGKILALNSDELTANSLSGGVVGEAFFGDDYSDAGVNLVDNGTYFENSSFESPETFASATTDITPNGGHPIAHAVDGNATSTFWWPGSNFTGDNVFDFGVQTDIDTIKIARYTGSGSAYYPKLITVEVSDDDVSYSTILTEASVPQTGSTVSIDLLGSYNTRYVRMTFQANTIGNSAIMYELWGAVTSQSSSNNTVKSEVPMFEVAAISPSTLEVLNKDSAPLGDSEYNVAYSVNGSSFTSLVSAATFKALAPISTAIFHLEIQPIGTATVLASGGVSISSISSKTDVDYTGITIEDSSEVVGSLTGAGLFAAKAGIGTDSPARDLHVHDASTAYLMLSNNTSGQTTADGFQLGQEGLDTFMINREAGHMRFSTNNTEAMRLDSSQNLLVGKTAAGLGTKGAELQESGLARVTRNAAHCLEVNRQTDDGDVIRVYQDTIQVGSIATSGARLDIVSQANMAFHTSGVEAFRVDGSQNLLVGKTSISSAVAGCEIKSGGQLFATKDGDYCARFNRLTTDGAVIQIQQAGVLVGSIGTEGTKLDINGGGSLAFSINGSEKVQVESTGITRPGTDNTQSLGKSSFRWSTVYAGTGSINTSDERTKTEVVDVETLAMDAGDLISVKQFKFKDAVESKGSDARLHFGVIAQEVKAAFESVGLDGFAYGVLCYDEWEDEFKTVTVEPAVYETNIITPAVEGVEAVAEELNEDGDVIVEAVEAVEAVEEVTEQVLVTPAVTEEQLVTPAGNRYGVRYDELMALKIACLERKLA